VLVINRAHNRISNIKIYCHSFTFTTQYPGLCHTPVYYWGDCEQPLTPEDPIEPLLTIPDQGASPLPFVEGTEFIAGPLGARPNAKSKRQDLHNFSSAIVGAFEIQKIQDAAGNVVNMDEFSVHIDRLPNEMNAYEFLHHIRTNINDFVNTNYSQFTPYDQTISGYPFNDTQKWFSHDPLGALIHIGIPNDSALFGDDGSVIVSNHTPSSRTFTTISALYDWEHPVSGNREFGFIENNDGSYTFYTKGVDRFTQQLTGETVAHIMTLGDPFSKADDLWKSFQKGLKKYVNNYGGQASTVEPKTIRADWEHLQNVFNGIGDLNTLGCK